MKIEIMIANGSCYAVQYPTKATEVPVIPPLGAIAPKATNGLVAMIGKRKAMAIHNARGVIFPCGDLTVYDDGRRCPKRFKIVFKC